MEYLGKSQLLMIIGMFLNLILISVFLVIIPNPILAIILEIAIIVLSVYIYFKIKEWYPKRILKLSKEKFDLLKNKNNKSLFEELYIKAYNDLAIDILQDVIDKNNIKNIHSLDFDASYDKRYISFDFNHKRHNVNYRIYDDKVIFFIDSPAKYDKLDINKKYEKEYTIDISINDYSTLEDFFERLIPSISDNLLKIDDFEEKNNIVIINNKTNDEILDYMGYYKYTCLLVRILSVILFIVMIIMNCVAVVDFTKSSNFVSEFLPVGICLVIIDIFVIFAYIYSITMIIYYKKLKFDIKNKVVESIKGKACKAKIVSASVGYKSNTTVFACGVKIYFKSPKKEKLFFVHYFDVPTRKQKQEIINFIMKNELDLVYYIKSKIIVSGIWQIRKKIKKIIK